MATTSLWRIKGYMGNVLTYVENPDKTIASDNSGEIELINGETLQDVISYTARDNATNRRQLVWGLNCSTDNALEDMLRVKRAWKKENGTVAYHGYQSFARGEVTPEIAHEIGKRLAQEVWGDRYQVYIATHLDKESHIHNHFVINTVSFVDGRKYHRTKEDYQYMRAKSDELCREYGLSVVVDLLGKKKNYGQWSAEQNGKPTHRSLIRADIDRAISASVTDRDFFRTLEQMGYEFKFYAESGKRLERPSLRPPKSTRFYRFDRLGAEYSLNDIMDRILENIRRNDPFPEAEREAVSQYRAAHPRHTKHKGFAALYYYYCYELNIIKKYPASVKRVSVFLREDLLKLDRLDAQTRFLCDNGIETIDDLNAYRTKAKGQIDALIGNRTTLRNELKRAIHAGDDAAVLAVKEKIAAVSGEIKELRKTLDTCDSVEQRAQQMQKELAEIEKQNEKEVETDELLRRRSRAGNENITRRS